MRNDDDDERMLKIGGIFGIEEEEWVSGCVAMDGSKNKSLIFRFIFIRIMHLAHNPPIHLHPHLVCFHFNFLSIHLSFRVGISLPSASKPTPPILH